MKPKLFLIISSLLSVAFVFAAALNLSPYLRGPAPYFPNWQWEYNFVNTYPHIWAPILIATTILFFYYRIESNKKLLKHEKLVVLSFAFLGFIFQYALLFANRAGVNGLLSRIISPDVNGYYSTALGITTVSDFLKNYNNSVLSFFMHAQGHPPFAILFFYIINKFFEVFPFLSGFTNSLSPQTYLIHQIWIELSIAERASAIFSTFFIPFLVSLIAILIFYLSKKLYDTRTAFRSLVLYLFIPSVLLFIPINDSFISIFPLCSLLLLLRGISHKNKPLLILSGIIFSIGIYFSISLLPLILIFILLTYSKFKGKQRSILGYSSLFLLGNVLIPFLLYIFFQFDSVLLFQILMKGLPEQRLYSTWVLYNLYDFFIFTGIPIAIAYIVILYSQTKLIINKKWNKLDIAFLSFNMMLFLVNFSGSVRGEVARIWIPFVPFYLIPIVGILLNKKFKTIHFIILLVIQLLIILTLNEYWVTFW